MSDENEGDQAERENELVPNHEMNEHGDLPEHRDLEIYNEREV